MNKRFEEQLKRDPILRERYAKMPPGLPKWKSKPKPVLEPVEEISDQLVAAAKANPESVRVRVSARASDNTVVVDPPRRGHIVTEAEQIQRHREILHNEMEARWASRNNPPLVQRDYDPIKRFQEGLGE
jgi:hypothetical protein